MMTIDHLHYHDNVACPPMSTQGKERAMQPSTGAAQSPFGAVPHLLTLSIPDTHDGRVGTPTGTLRATGLHAGHPKLLSILAGTSWPTPPERCTAHSVALSSPSRSHTSRTARLPEQ